MKLLTIAFLSFLILMSNGHSSILPKEAFTFDFNVKMIKMSRMKEEKLLRSMDLLREVFASEEFRKKILNHKFRGRKSFAYNRGLSNREIYHRILMGVEKLVPYRNNAMDVEVELYADYNSSVLGFTRPNTKRIWMNKKYFDKYCSAKVASHLTHEWLHKLGFDHEKERSHTREYSVPYAVGYIVRDLALKLNRRYRTSNSRY